MSIKFLVPEAGGFDSRLATYIYRVKDQIEIFHGKAWYTGSKSGLLVKQTMGKNMISKVPNEIASRLALQDPEKYTFYSFRWTSSTSAADGGAPTEQMIDFSGWKNGSMCTEYVSSSRLALVGLAKPKESSGSKEVMLKRPTWKRRPPSTRTMPCTARPVFSLVLVPLLWPTRRACRRPASNSYIFSIPAAANGNVNIKFVVLSNMSGGFITL